MKQVHTIDSFDITLLIISAKPGCGKTSLISKIADEHKDETSMFFVNLARYREHTLEQIVSWLRIKENRGYVYVLDGLDEIECWDIDILNHLVRELYNNGCRCILTCRSSIIPTMDIAHSLHINLRSFEIEQATTWLEMYNRASLVFDIEEWKKRLNNTPDSIRDFVFTPLILYICV